MKKILIISLTLLALIIPSLSAEDYYDTGSQIFTITVGLDLPLSNTYMDGDEMKTTTFWGEDGTHFNIGGYGSIDYEVFTNSKIAMGGEIGYQFNRILDGNLFTMVPMLFKITYLPLQGKFELPLSFGAGFNYLSYNNAYNNASKFALNFTLSVGARYFITDNWALGIKSGVSFTPELYLQNSKKNGYYSSIPVHLFASYRH